MDIKKYIRDVKDFPKEGVIFKDITPLLSNPEVFKFAIDSMIEDIKDWNFDTIIGPEARGFIFAAPLAYTMGKKFVPVRKPGKLPYKKISASYDLEYGSATLEMHIDAIEKGERVIIVDDVLATGGTTAAIVELVEKSGGIVEGIYNFAELSFLNPREKLNGLKVDSLIEY